MAFIETTAPQAASGAVRDMYERQQKGWGFVPNYAKPFSHRPEVMTLWADLQRGLRAHVDARRFELVTFAAARALKSSYCSLAHGRALLQWFSAEEVKELAETGPDQATCLNAAERAMLAYAAKAATTPFRVTAGEVEGLKAHGFGDAEIFDIAALATARAFFSGVVEALGGEADASFLELEEALRDALTPGRPIDYRPVQRLTPDRTGPEIQYPSLESTG
jgi:uncharacterized peroxidase-related enzyme